MLPQARSDLDNSVSAENRIHLSVRTNKPTTHKSQSLQHYLPPLAE